MRIVFSGAGPSAVLATTSLIKQGHEVVIIEADKDKIDRLADNLDCSFLHGDAAKPAVLGQVDPKNSDFLFCLTASDQANIITSLLGRSMGFKRVVTSIEDEDLENLCRELGLEDIIIPSRTLSQHLADMVRGLDSIELSTLLKGGARFFSFAAEKDYANAELDLPENTRTVFYYRGDDFYFVDEKSTFKKGDEIVLLTHSENLEDLYKRWNPKQFGQEGSE